MTGPLGAAQVWDARSAMSRGSASFPNGRGAVRMVGDGSHRGGASNTSASRRKAVSATLENEADPTLENEATGSCCLVCR
ncbi:hypothetical protein, partial [Nocardioides ganghwensis]|uniref:hypothetical protein n=1 Tax=Nocardioides ganghwensis TaxID=252230 RepID=UPI001A9247FA